jgi:serine/threonine-protein kinase
MQYLGDSDGSHHRVAACCRDESSRAGTAALIKVLVPKGRLEKSASSGRRCWQATRQTTTSGTATPSSASILGKNDEFRRARDAMLRRFGQSDDWITAERTSLACLLLPGSPDELRSAAALAERAVANASKSEPDNAYVQFVKGLSEYRQDRLAEAMPLLKETARKIPSRPGPRLVLAMAQFRSGSPQEARKSLAAAVAACDWKQVPDDFPSVWTSHLLRREAEVLIVPNLGRVSSRESISRKAMKRDLRLWRSVRQGLYAVCAQLYADTFAAGSEFRRSLDGRPPALGNGS